MRLVSYAQNYEDIMLWRALKDIDAGFYIDIGANDPVADSVTKLFYDRGWSGINVEPLAEHYNDLCRERPRDKNVQCAVGAEAGTLSLWVPEVRGWATASADAQQLHEQSGVEGVIVDVPQRTLANICRDYAAPEIHFLKVDVEGMEAAVLQGNDWQRFRPWVVVVEATRPGSPEQCHDVWESLILEAGYTLVYNDGLNRFYVASEHAELAEKFRVPPNVFDAFVRSSEVALEDALAKARVQIVETKFREREAWQHVEALRGIEARATELHEAVEAMRGSLSWRITAPLRWGARQMRLIRAQGISSRLRIFLRRLMLHAKNYLDRDPAARARINEFLHKTGLAHVARKIYHKLLGEASIQADSDALLSKKLMADFYESIQTRDGTEGVVVLKDK